MNHRIQSPKNAVELTREIIESLDSFWVKVENSDLFNQRQKSWANDRTDLISFAYDLATWTVMDGAFEHKKNALAMIANLHSAVLFSEDFMGVELPRELQADFDKITDKLKELREWFLDTYARKCTKLELLKFIESIERPELF